MEKDFDSWNKKKKELHLASHEPPFFKERDVWWTSIGTNLGYEEDGKGEHFVRPVLIIKKFNRYLFLGFPMSTKLKDNKYYLPITLQGKTVSVLISQIRIISSKRLWNKFASIPKGKESWLMPI